MHTPQLHKEGFGAWLPVIGLALAAFVFNTSEFLPVGLLPDIAEGLGSDVSFMGLLISGYAAVVAVMSLPLTVMTAKFERRKLLLVLVFIFAVCHFAVLWTDSFSTLYASRIGVALTHSIFWAIMTPLTARVAPFGKRALGLACVMGGSIVATVLGVPIGTHLGHLFGWRETFAVIGIAAMVLFAMIFAVLPECKSDKAGSFASVPMLFKRPALVELYAITMIAMLGQFCAYSYISPILTSSGVFVVDDVVMILFVFGISGIIGTVLMSKTVDKHRIPSFITPLVILAACLYLLAPMTASYAGTIALTVVWGASMTALMLVFQSTLLDVASDAADVATSMYSGIFNVGIGGGAFIGSIVSHHYGFYPVSFVGAGLVTVTLLILLLAYMKTGCVIAGFKQKEHLAKGEALK